MGTQATGWSTQDLFAFMFQSPAENVIPLLGGEKMRVAFLDQSNRERHVVELTSMCWSDCSEHGWGEFCVAASAFYHARMGEAMTGSQMRSLFKSFKDLAGAALVGGFGFKFQLMAPGGAMIAEACR